MHGFIVHFMGYWQAKLTSQYKLSCARRRACAAVNFLFRDLLLSNQQADLRNPGK